MRNFSNVRRVVIKIGTNTLAKKNGGGVDAEYIKTVAMQIKQLCAQNIQAVLVSSGAIGMGSMVLGLKEKVSEMQMRQACAAIGQPVLMHEYQKAFTEFDIKIAQVLLTAEVLNNRKTYLNMRNVFERLLELGVVPIVNENDSVSTDEIGTAFGDNDRLSALVASKIDADLLILLSDIDAFYDSNPRENPDAKPIDVVYEITDEVLKKAGKKGSTFSTGGMKTKILAAQITANAGCRMVLADGRCEDIISKIIAGDKIGTLFMPKRKLGNRQRWILNSMPAGKIEVDDGAACAIKKHKSLLASGIKAVSGKFEAGEVVIINNIAKAVSDLSSDDLKAVAGKHSSKIKEILGDGKKDTAAIPENIVFFDID